MTRSMTFPRAQARLIIMMLSLTLAVNSAGCRLAKNPTRRPGKGRPKLLIRSYSETVPFTAAAVLGPMVYAGTPRGVIRFDGDGEGVVWLTAAEGLVGSRIYAMAASPSTGLWIATEAGLSNYHNDRWLHQPLDGKQARQVRALAVKDQAVWIGGGFGLKRFQDGTWEHIMRDVRVSSLQNGPMGGRMWVGTLGRGVYHIEKGRLVPHGAASGQPLVDVTQMSLGATGALLVAGTGPMGSALAIYDGTYWAAYHPSPKASVHWVAQFGAELLTKVGRHVFALRMAPLDSATPNGPVALRRQIGPQAPDGYPAPRLYTVHPTFTLPDDITFVAGHGETALVGTRGAGLLRVGRATRRWYRSRALVDGAAKLSVACSAARCYLAGADGGFMYDGRQFLRVEVPTLDGRILAFVRAAGSNLSALIQHGSGRALDVVQLRGNQWINAQTFHLVAPTPDVRVRFARMAPTGAIWAGLAYTDAAGDERSWGVSVLQPGGTVTHHRTTLLPDERRAPGALALPDDIRDVAFLRDGTVMLSTGAGICRVTGDEVTVFGENEGLASEIVYRITPTPDGGAYAASLSGIMRYNGTRWLPYSAGPTLRLLQGAVRAVEVDGAALWVATPDGLAHVVEDRLELLDRRSGLAGDDILDVVRDEQGRLWVLSTAGLSILTKT